MGRLKTFADKLNYKKVVHKHAPNGRCYNTIDGLGWNHYTKGFRKHSIHSNAISRGTLILFGFLAKVLGKNTNEKEELTDENANVTKESEIKKESE